MKKLSLLFVAIIASLSLAMPAQAIGFKIGPRIGMNVNSLHFNKDVWKSENRTGFTGGLEVNLSLPLGFGIDASVMYARRSVEGQLEKLNTTIKDKKLDYISVPINIEWALSLPLVSKIITPYIYTGPDFAFRVTKAAIKDAWNDHKVDVAWDFGLGVQLIKHLRISATYGLGLTKWANWVGVTDNAKDNTARTNCWTVTAAWLF